MGIHRSLGGVPAGRQNHGLLRDAAATSEVVDEAGGEAVIEFVGGGDGEPVAEADVHFRQEAVADADESFGFEIALGVAVERGGAGEFEVKVDEACGCLVTVAVIFVGEVRVFAEGFHEAEAEFELGLIRVKAVGDGDVGVQGEPVPEIVPHGDAGGDRCLAAEGAGAGGQAELSLGGKQEAVRDHEKCAWDDREIAEAGCGADALLILPDVGDFQDDAEAFREGPFEFEFGLVFGESIALGVGVIQEKIATGEGRLDPEGVDDGGAERGEVDVLEGFHEVAFHGVELGGKGECGYGEGASD